MHILFGHWLHNSLDPIWWHRSHISLDCFPGTRWLDPHHSTSPLMLFMESRHCPVSSHPLYRWSASWALSILTWQCLSCILTWRDSLHICLARTTTSESETHELVNSVASPSQSTSTMTLPFTCKMLMASHLHLFNSLWNDASVGMAHKLNVYVCIHLGWICDLIIDPIPVHD